MRKHFLFWQAAFTLVAMLITVPVFAGVDEGSGDPRPPDTSEKIAESIYRPWSGPLEELGRLIPEQKNYVFWIHVPAQHPLDLRSGEYFRRWILATPVTEMSISHNMVAFRCHKDNGEVVTGATGITGGSAKQDAKMFLAGYGLSVFLTTFTDGHLNSQDEVGAYVTANLQNRGTVYAGFEVSTEQCASMQNFINEFIYHPNKPHQRFGLLQDPEKMEGGGCVTLASAILKKAGQLDSVIPQFYRTVHAARYLMGGNLKPIENTEPPETPWLNGRTKFVSMNMFLDSPWNMEPESSPGSVSLRLMDPEKMLYSLRQYAAVYLEGLPESKRSSERELLAQTPLGTRVVVSGNNLVDPGRSIEFSQYIINDSFDTEMRDVGAVARDWFRGKVNSGYKIRREQVYGMPVLLMEKN